MRLLHVLSSPLDPGGMERVVIALCADAVQRGDQTLVASAPGRWVPKLEATGARHVAIPHGGRSLPGIATKARALARLIRADRPDVVHAHNVTATAASRGALIAARAGRSVPLLATVQGLEPGDYHRAAPALRFTTKRIVACAPAVARRLARSGVPPARIAVVPNASDLEPVSPARRSSLWDRLELPPAPVVGVGRLVEQKDWPTVIAAAADLRPRRPVIVAGDGPLRQDLEKQAARAGAPVRFVGHVEDVAALLGGAACFVSTSRWEGLPLALLEALSLGVPSIATAVDGVADLVPPTAARLVPPGDPAAVAKAVSELLDDADLATRLSNAARVASRSWSEAAMLQRYRDLYRELLAQPR